MLTFNVDSRTSLSRKLQLRYRKHSLVRQWMCPSIATDKRERRVTDESGCVDNRSGIDTIVERVAELPKPEHLLVGPLLPRFMERSEALKHCIRNISPADTPFSEKRTQAQRCKAKNHSSSSFCFKLLLSSIKESYSSHQIRLVYEKIVSFWKQIVSIYRIILRCPRGPRVSRLI